ncbi:MAG: hypothetical protein NVSMB6_29210 [Burkholderiaceae bacterium]
MSYRYAPSVFQHSATVETDVLYVVGGLYGNEMALASVLDMFAVERGAKHLIFNGDFNWFNVDHDSFRRINETVLSFDATRGNIETELDKSTTADSETGCGCGYPEWVDDRVVAYSNDIMRRLARTAARFPKITQRLAMLPMHRRIDVSGEPVGVVHGDGESLSGWGFAAEHLCQEPARAQAQQWFDAAGVRIFACTHTCTPIFVPLNNSVGSRCLIANNGAAGMPNFTGMATGLLTRIARTPSETNTALYAAQIGNVVVEAMPIAFDQSQWEKAFLHQWPLGSSAYSAYWQRIAEGPAYRIGQAAPPGNGKLTQAFAASASARALGAE